MSLLGTLDGKGIATDADSVNRESCKVQCIVARATPFNLISPGTPPPPILAHMIVGTDTSSVEYKTYREASPLFHVTNDDPPFLLIHGDADNTVPYKNSEVMEKALRKVGVEVKLITVPGGGHGPKFPGAINPPDYLGESTRWFDTYLIQK